jgi:hypothetical protein
MTILGVLGLLFVLSPTPGADVSGVWNLDMHWLGSDTHATGVCTLKQDAEKLSGTCESAKSTITGEAHERSVTLQIAVEQDGNKGMMTFTGTLNEDGKVITGSCRIVGGQEGTFVMNRRNP